MHRSCRAFTLIELFVVVAIIVLLLAILMPALARVKQQALTVRCGANLRALGQSTAQYVEEFSGYLLPGYVQVADKAAAPAQLVFARDVTKEENWQDQLVPILGNRLAADNYGSFSYKQGALVCPVSDTTRNMHGQYAYNHRFSAAYGANADSVGKKYPVLKYAQVEIPYVKIMLMDRTTFKTLLYGTNFTPWVFRHVNNSTNALFTDYHVEALTTKQIADLSDKYWVTNWPTSAGADHYNYLFDPYRTKPATLPSR